MASALWRTQCAVVTSHSNSNGVALMRRGPSHDVCPVPPAGVELLCPQAFRCMPQAVRSRLAKACQGVQLPPGAVVFQEDDKGDAMYGACGTTDSMQHTGC